MTGRALVTGGTSDIGRALCRSLAQDGATVDFTYFSDHDGARALRAELDACSGAGRAEQVNFAHAESTAAFINALERPYGIFVHNAASGVLREIVDLKMRHLDWCLDVNARAFFRIAQHMLQNDLILSPGRMVALSSLGARRVIPQYGAVAASKAALEALARSLAVEAGPKGVTVNVLAPGIVETRALDHFPNREQLLDVATQKTSMGRLCTPADVASVLRFICSADAQMVHGVTLDVDGGYAIVA